MPPNLFSLLIGNQIEFLIWYEIGSQDSKSVKRAQDIICKRLQFATGARLFEPEPAKKGNSNTGVNLKTITQMAEKSAEILDCSQELLESLHELLGRIESLKPQDPGVLKNLSERIFHLFQTDFGEFSKMSPSFHRAISHSEEFAWYYQKEQFHNRRDVGNCTRSDKLSNQERCGIFSTARCSSSHSISHNPRLLLQHFLIIPTSSSKRQLLCHWPFCRLQSLCSVATLKSHLSSFEWVFRSPNRVWDTFAIWFIERVLLAPQGALVVIAFLITPTSSSDIFS